MEKQTPRPENESDTNVKPERLQAIRNLIRNLFQPNRFYLAYSTEVKLREAEQRIALLQERNTNLLRSGRSASAKWGGYELLLAALAKKHGTAGRLVIPQGSIDLIKDRFKLSVTKHGEAYILKLKEK